MHTLPAELLPLFVNFQPLLSKSVWEKAQTLLVGAILENRHGLPLQSLAQAGEVVITMPDCVILKHKLTRQWRIGVE